MRRLGVDLGDIPESGICSIPGYLLGPAVAELWARFWRKERLEPRDGCGLGTDASSSEDALDSDTLGDPLIIRIDCG
jgi:hypothetical protein